MAETEAKHETHVHADGTVHEGPAHDEFPADVVKIEDAGAARKKLTIEIHADKIAGKLKEAFGELQRDAVLPGFRKGRAPKRLLEKRFGGELQNTVKGQIIAEAYQKAAETHKLDAIGEPEIDMEKVKLPESGPLTVTMEVEVTPEFELPTIDKLEIKKPKLEANDERLNLAVDNLRKHFGHWHVTGKPSTADDALRADVKILGDAGAGLAEQNNMQIPVKSEAIAGVPVTGLQDKLTGLNPGAVVEVEGTVPDTYANESLRGKSIKTQITVKEVVHQDLPEVNDDFAKMLGFGSVDELKNDLRERLKTQLEQEAKGAMADQVYRHLLGATKLDLPANLSQRQTANVFRRRATEMLEKGVPEVEIAKHLDDLKASATQQAMVDLKLFFILTKLAQKFEIDVSDGEVNTRIAAIAMQYGRRPEKLKSQMSSTGQLEQLYLQIRDSKVVDKLLETANVTEVDEKAYAEEVKKLPPLVTGPNIGGVSQNAPAAS